MEYIDVDQLLARREDCRVAKLSLLNPRMLMARRLRERGRERVAPAACSCKGARELPRRCRQSEDRRRGPRTASPTSGTKMNTIRFVAQGIARVTPLIQAPLADPFRGASELY